MKVSRYFSRSEFKCKCNTCGFDAVDVELLKVLEDVRAHFGNPVKINSACRCVTHNHSEGGSVTSQHLYGKACDIVVKDIPSYEVYEYLNDTHGGGLGKYDTFTHIDVRSEKARWDKTQEHPEHY